jgi:hypothetical protein
MSSTTTSASSLSSIASTIAAVLPASRTISASGQKVIPSP